MKSTLSPLLLAQLSPWIADHMGLHFPVERWSDLERHLAIAAQELEYPNPEAFISRLLSEPVSRNMIETLAGYLTVGETYFFREPRSFEALESRILPELLRSRQNEDRHLRIWSAGCCTGEEPYSIAMLLDKLIPDDRHWCNTLLATDITPHFLRKAIDGNYSEWSFRGTPDWVRGRYFDKKSGGRFKLHPRIRQRVTFSNLNLADDPYPSLINNTHAMDVIFCRNVLMYFSETQAKKVVEGLYKSLVDGGWLITSSTEPYHTLFSSFTPVEFPGGIVYRKLSKIPSRGKFPGHPTAALDAKPVMLPGSLPKALTEPSPVLNIETRCLEGSDELSQRARDCANQGKLTEAAECCLKAIAIDKFNPGYRFLLAMVQQEQGLNDAAVKSLLHTLYLDSEYVLAHFALGNLYLMKRRRQEAEKYFDNVQVLLQGYPETQAFPGSEGLTAGQLGKIVDRLQAGLSNSPI